MTNAHLRIGHCEATIVAEAIPKKREIASSACGPPRNDI
jgi:hypothetical protein